MSTGAGLAEAPLTNAPTVVVVALLIHELSVPLASAIGIALAVAVAVAELGFWTTKLDAFNVATPDAAAFWVVGIPPRLDSVYRPSKYVFRTDFTYAQLNFLTTLLASESINGSMSVSTGAGLAEAPLTKIPIVVVSSAMLLSILSHCVPS